MKLLYEWMPCMRIYAICIFFLFPIIVILGSSPQMSSKIDSIPVCDFLGRISYPLCLVHYPFIYMYFKYAHSNKSSLIGCIGWVVTKVLFCIFLAYLCERFYDVPIRNWLRRK